MHKNHWLMMALCLLPILIIIIGGYTLGVNRNYLYLGLILLCPIAHYVMMRKHH